MKKVLQWVHGLMKVPGIRFLVNVQQRFGDDNGAFYAAGLAFFILLSFAPVILTAIAILGCFINQHTAGVQVTAMIENLLPAGGARQEAAKFLTVQLKIDDQVTSIVRHRGVAGVFGFLSLVWATIQVFINAGVAMNAMWEVKESRNWFTLRGLAILLMILTGVITVLSLFLSGIPTAIAKHRLPFLENLPIPHFVVVCICELSSLLLNCFTYTVIYKLLPNAKVRWQEALMGGVAAGVFFEAAKTGIAAYVLRENHTVYGDLADLILFILWIYYSMMIFLLGAEITAATARSEPDRRMSSVKRRIVRGKSDNVKKTRAKSVRLRAETNLDS